MSGPRVQNVAQLWERELGNVLAAGEEIAQGLVVQFKIFPAMMFVQVSSVSIIYVYCLLFVLLHASGNVNYFISTVKNSEMDGCLIRCFIM